MAERKADKLAKDIEEALSEDKTRFDLLTTQAELINVKRTLQRTNRELGQAMTSNLQKDARTQELELALAERDQQIAALKTKSLDPESGQKVEEFKDLIKEGEGILFQFRQISQDPYHPNFLAAQWAERYFWERMRRVLGVDCDDVAVERAYRQDLLTQTLEQLADADLGIAEAYEKIEELEADLEDFRDANRILRRRIINLDQQTEGWGRIFGFRRPTREITIGQRYAYTLRQPFLVNGNHKNP